MPRPLSELTVVEQGLYATLSQQPQATDLPSLLADNAEDRGEQARADLLHHNARLALCELLRHRSLTDAECARVLQNPNDTARQISRLLGRPEPNAPLPGVLTEAGLHEQFAFAQTLLAAYGLPAGGATADGVWRNMQTNPALREQIENEHRSLLLLVPRLPLSKLTAALTDGLRRNEHLLGLGDQRLHDQPVFLDPLYDEQPLEYLASKRGPTDPDRWLTEGEWRAEKPIDILFVNPSPDVPQAARNRTARQAWANRRPGEALFTAQAWCLLSLLLLELRGDVLDRRAVSLLPGARFVPSGGVPDGLWEPAYRRAGLGWRNPGLSYRILGPRAASEGV